MQHIALSINFFIMLVWN